MIILALDLSKRSTGWALWAPGWEKPRFGRWTLGSEFTTPGGVYLKLHRCLDELRQVAPFEKIYHEEAINPANLNGVTNIATLRLAAGLAAHVESFAEARRCVVKAVNIGTWRADFIGRDEVGQANAEARRKRKATGKGSARDTLKALAMERCRQFGWTPRGDDEADGLGILDYAIALNGITAPWRAEQALRPMSEVG